MTVFFAWCGKHELVKFTKFFFCFFVFSLLPFVFVSLW